MKKILAAGLVAALLGIGCAAAEEIPLAGLQVSYTLRAEGRADTEIRGILMVPLRETAEQFGFTVTWEDGAAVVSDEKLRTRVTPGEDVYSVSAVRDGEQWVTEPFSLGVPPALSGGTLYVPISFFQPLLTEEGKVVTFEGRTLTVSGAEKIAETEENQAVGLPNPFRDFETLEEAEVSAGYGLTLPGISAEEILYRAIPGELLEVIYKNGGEEILRVRKGSTARDVSGDYNEYSSIKTVRVGELATRMRGDGETVSLVTWIADGHAYALSSAEPKTEEEMAALVAEIE